MTRSSLVSTFALLVALPTAIWANGTRLPNQDARATARGDAFVATADSAAAVYYNPAGLTQLQGGDVTVGSYFVAPEHAYEGPLGQLDAKHETHWVPHAYVGRRLEGSRLALGAGVFAPFGLSSDWGTGQAFNTLASRNEIVFQTIALAAAYEVSDSFSLGAAVHWNDVEVDLRRDTGLAPGSELRFLGTDQNWSGSVGFLWEMAPGHFLGGRYTLSSTSKLNGTLDLTLIAPTSPASGSLAFPENVVLSYAYRPTPKLNVEVSLDWTNWERLDALDIANGVMPLSVPFHWDASFYADLGVSYQVDDQWRVHGGYVWSQNSESDAVYNPAVPDDTRNFLSAGLEYTAGRFSVIAVFQHGLKTTRVVSGSPLAPGGFNADGRYTTSFLGGSLGARWVF